MSSQSQHGATLLGTIMCVALILILKNFYKFYDATVEYCEHITAALLVTFTVLMIMIPILFAVNPFDEGDDPQRQPFMAIVVLVCGVAGGLIVVISFILFCKYCVKKKQNLAETSPAAALKAKLQQNKHTYESLGNSIGSSTITSPIIPADCEAYWQQPQTHYTPYDLIANPHLIDKDSNKNKLATITQNDERISVQLIETVDEKQPVSRPASNGKRKSSKSQAADIAESEDVAALFQTVGDSRRQSEVAAASATRVQKNTVERATSVSPRLDLAAAEDQFSPPTNDTNYLLAPHVSSRDRSRSYTKSSHQQTSPPSRTAKPLSQYEQLRPSASHTNYYAEEYDRKYNNQSQPVSRSNFQALKKSMIEHTLALPGVSWGLSAIGGGSYTNITGGGESSRSPRSPLNILPESRQFVIDKTSPPASSKQISFQFPQPVAEAYAELNNNNNKIYDREHRYAKSYTLTDPREQDPLVKSHGGAASRGVYAKEHRQALSYAEPSTHQQSQPRRKAFVRQQPIAHPDSGRVEASNEGEFSLLQDFNRKCEMVFEGGKISAAASTVASARLPSLGQITAEAYAGITDYSSGSGSNEGADAKLPFLANCSLASMNNMPRRQLPLISSTRQAQSFDSSVTDEEIQRRSGPRSPIVERQARSFDVQELARQRALMEGEDQRSLNRFALLADDAMTHKLRLHNIGGTFDLEEDATAENIKHECKKLWALRSTIEQAPEADIGLLSPTYQSSGYPEIEEQYATTSGTTSFESNTEPVLHTLEEYNATNSPKTSGAFLEPPAAYEARKQKYRNLFARRQIQLQQQRGCSFENSFDSFETVDSLGTDGSRPEFFVASFESNVSNVSGVSNVSNVSQTGEQTDDSSGGRKRMAELKNDSGYKSQSTDAQQLHDPAGLSPEKMPSQQQHSPLQQIAYDSTIRDYSKFLSHDAAPHGAMAKFGAPMRRQDTSDTNNTNRSDQSGFLDSNLDVDSDSVRSDVPSCESFDDGIAPTPPRRMFGMATRAFRRDFSIDSKTDSVFREFLRYDPILDTRHRREDGTFGIHLPPSASGSGRARGQLGGRGRYSLEQNRAAYGFSPDSSFNEEDASVYGPQDAATAGATGSAYQSRHGGASCGIEFQRGAEKGYDSLALGDTMASTSGYCSSAATNYTKTSIPVIRLPTDDELSVGD